MTPNTTRRLLLLLFSLTSLLSLPAVALEGVRVEPPDWWVGMRETRLQLMLHGDGLARTTVSLKPYPGVRLIGSKIAEGSQASPNYRFVDLDVSRQARPGQIELRIKAPGQRPQSLRYSLRARADGSADRQGFGPRDAIYLLVPDRFSRGQAGWATPTGIREAYDRTAPSGRHGGDLAGMRQHLDYIAGLGFTQIWPTPLVENNSAKYSYHGYGATDYYRIDPRFGSFDDYRSFVDEARARGLGVIQDIVLNHIGVDHPWMRDLPAAEWLNQWPSFTETHHARVTVQDPNAAPSDRKRFTDGWFVPGMPDLNQRQPQLATYLIQNSLWWIESVGLSGIRTDTYSYSDKDFLAAWSGRVMQEYPRLNIVGEEWSPHPAIVAYWQRGKRNHDGYASHAPSLMDFPLHGSLLAALTETDGHDSGFTKLYESVAHDFLYADPAQLVLFEGNHDTPRLLTAVHGDPALARMAMAFLATSRRIPQLFYGSELLMESPKQRDDGKLRADMPGGWSNDAVSAFSGQGLSPAQREMQDWVKRLFNWRKTATVIHEGRLMQYAPLQGCYVFFRFDATRTVMVVLNKNAEATVLPTRRFPERLQAGDRARDVLGGAQFVVGEAVVVPPRSALILEVQR